MKTLRVLPALALLAIAAEAGPIRVGVFKGTGTARYWHTNIHTAATEIGKILAAPANAGLGGSLASYPDGFSYTLFGVSNAGCSSGCAPSTAEKETFIAALDTLDVVIFLTPTDIGSIFTSTNQRARLQAFFRSKGVVSVHQSTDSYGTWAAWDSLHGARFQNHPTSDRAGRVVLDTVTSPDAAWYFLNAGLSDTTFLDEWITFTTSGAKIRSIPDLKVLFTVDEKSYDLGGSFAMGDHPITWFRPFPEGGRLFYTGLGHRAQNYQGGMNPRFVRRQLYNGILWVGRSDSGGPVAVKPTPRVSSASPAMRIHGDRLVVEAGAGDRIVSVHAADGRLLDSRSGPGEAAFALRSGTLYFITVTGGPAAKRASVTRRVFIP